MRIAFTPLDVKALTHVIRKVCNLPKNAGRPLLQAVEFEWDPKRDPDDAGELIAVATDSYRMVVERWVNPVGEDFAETKFTVAVNGKQLATALGTVVKTLGRYTPNQPAGRVYVAFTTEGVNVSDLRRTVSIHVPAEQGSYPKWRSLIPSPEVRPFNGAQPAVNGEYLASLAVLPSMYDTPTVLGTWADGAGAELKPLGFSWRKTGDLCIVEGQCLLMPVRR